LADVRWTEPALQDLQNLDKPIAQRIVRKISWFSRHFDAITPESLSAELSGTYKLRVGDWRVIYTLEAATIVIHAVGHRRDIYKQ
jgi:mRNA interferase RelE/StbE